MLFAVLVAIDEIPKVLRRFVGGRRTNRLAFQILDEFLDRPRPLLGIAAHRPADGPIDPLGNLRIEFARGDQFVANLPHPAIEGADLAEWNFAGQERVEGGPDAVNVAAD